MKPIEIEARHLRSLLPLVGQLGVEVASVLLLYLFVLHSELWEEVLSSLVEVLGVESFSALAGYTAVHLTELPVESRSVFIVVVQDRVDALLRYYLMWWASNYRTTH
jgi:hypothetical protein